MLVTYHVEPLKGTTESRAEQEERLLRRMFGDVDFDRAIMRSDARSWTIDGEWNLISPEAG